jgi:large subunit ribosomal protein L6
MSRIGNASINIPEGVEISLANDVISVKGPKGELTQEMKPGFTMNIEEGVFSLARPSDSKEHRALHGLYRSLVSNMVEGVTNGHKLQQELVGVGYKATNQGQILDLTIGYSHRVMVQVPEEVKVTTETVKGKNPIITLESMDKQLVGQVAAKIRSLRKPEPYKGKGIKFVGEVLRRKAGKSAAK